MILRGSDKEPLKKEREDLNEGLFCEKCTDPLHKQNRR